MDRWWFWRVLNLGFSRAAQFRWFETEARKAHQPKDRVCTRGSRFRLWKAARRETLPYGNAYGWTPSSDTMRCVALLTCGSLFVVCASLESSGFPSTSISYCSKSRRPRRSFKKSKARCPRTRPWETPWAPRSVGSRCVRERCAHWLPVVGWVRKREPRADIGRLSRGEQSTGTRE